MEINVYFGDNLYTALIPFAKISELEQFPEITNISLPSFDNIANDSARSSTNVNPIQQGYDLPQAFKGKDVIVGVIDTGFEFNHINFKDNDGNSRILAAYLPEAIEGGESVFINGNTLPGRQYTSPADIALLTTDYTLQSHGCHVAGSAAGSYSANDYHGVATEADLVLCGLQSLSNTNIANAAAYIAEIARLYNKPAVINISLGGHSSAHDGSAFLCKAFDALASDGLIFVIAACNEGHRNIYLNTTFNKESKSDIQAQTVVVFRNIDSNVNIWNRSNQQFGIQFAVLNTNNEPLVESEIIYPDDNQKGEVSLSNAISSYFNGDIKASFGVERNNKSTMMIHLKGEFISFFDHRLPFRLSGEHVTSFV